MASPILKLVLLGRQGAGKGTQSARISKRYGLVHISTGDMLRAAMQEGSPFGIKASNYVDKGELVPDSVITGVLAERLTEPDVNQSGFILDGYPRSLAQAEALREILAPDDLSVAIYLEVPEDVVISRLASRRTCRICGANYSTDMPPKFDWTCDVCGGDVVQREDDREEVIANRLRLYREHTEPVIQFYRELGLLEVIDGLGGPDEVTERIVAALEHRGIVEE
jgi:adenylate kinase